MAPSISANLSRLHATVSELNKLAGTATEQIRDLDKLLEELSPGFEFFPDMVPPFDSSRTRLSDGRAVDLAYHLGYGRDDDGKFGLVVSATAAVADAGGRILRDEVGDAAGYEQVWVRRLDKCSRDIRIAALPKLPDFIERFTEHLGSILNRTWGNLAAAKAAADELRVAMKGRGKGE